ncbi:group II intron maturase-specific domain-containing protein [Phytohabitans kaempferiae]|uniref:Group II intron maturase-specific domain-containing protein n=1 Tax=Phytohabitans kaempferiae TaxID=1620943 RepID=A0ABV6M713_9ACTN
MGKVKTWTRRTSTSLSLDVLLIQLNRMLRGWCAYFRPGVSKATFQYLSSYTWDRVIRWLRRKHRRIKLEGPPPPLLLRRLVAHHRGQGTVQPGHGVDHPIPLPGISHPQPLARQMTNNTVHTGLAERPVP